MTPRPRTAAGRETLDWFTKNMDWGADEMLLDILAIEAESAAEWKRKYEGMVKERDDQVYRKRESRRILQERAAPLDVERKPGCIYKHPHPDYACRNQDDMREPPTEPLDVERLALAIEGQDSHTCDDRFRECAKAIAAAYARLSADEEGGT